MGPSRPPSIYAKERLNSHTKMNIKAIANKIGMDYEGALEYYGGEVHLLQAKLDSFISDADFDSLKSAVDSNDEAAVKAQAHKIRKIAEKVCLRNLEHLASNLETSGNLNAFTPLEKEYNEIVKALTEETEIKDVQ